MEKITFVVEGKEDKKNSVLYRTKDPLAPITSIYILRKYLGNNIPDKVRITLEDVQ